MPPQDDLCKSIAVTTFYRRARCVCELIASNSGGRAWTHHDHISDLLRKAHAGDTLKTDTRGGGNFERGNDLEDDVIGALSVVAATFRLTFSVVRNRTIKRKEN